MGIGRPRLRSKKVLYVKFFNPNAVCHSGACQKLCTDVKQMAQSLLFTFEHIGSIVNQDVKSLSVTTSNHPQRINNVMLNCLSRLMLKRE
jgi:hypothetical protein